MIASPSDAPTVQQITAAQLKEMMDSGTPLELIDVRTVEERAIAVIAGARHLDEEGHAHLMGLDRDTPVVFQCHHGIRSQAAAQHFLGQGFRQVYNLRGGIDAWSQLVDPTVPRY